MGSDPSSDLGGLPTRSKLLLTTLGALAVAAVIVVTAVLPVEYNRDPLGTGKALGLLRAPPIETAPAITSEAAEALEPLQQGDVAFYGGPYRTTAFEFVISPYDYIEFKYHLVKGAGMV